MSNSALVVAYQQYKSNPNVESYEVFGAELLKFMKAMLVIKYRSHFARVEDALGEASMRVFSNLDSFAGPPEKFLSWVKTIVLNEAARIGRRDLNNSQKDDVTYEESEMPHAAVDAKVDVERVLVTLPPLDRAIIRLMLKDHQGDEIAKELGIAEGTVWSRWARIKDKFRTQLGGENGPR